MKSYLLIFQKEEIDQTGKEKRRLSEELDKEKTDKTLIKELKNQVEELRSELSDQEDVILALQHACTVSIKFTQLRFPGYIN